MFLHPEPELMEPCASMLGDKFSVHMAQSGTEALTTLGITPIDIIVSAQDLPGMTGQEALREAKKRWPKTRGILIANDAMTPDDVAALVTVKHLNQILTAGVSVAEICAAIHQELNAADLPQPANDFSAGPREGTDATGSFRTDSMRLDNNATGSFEQLGREIPTLEPGAAAAEQARAISDVELVVLTNDSSFLKTIRAATGASHVVNHAPNLQEAVDIVEEGKSGVLITDAAVAVKDVQTITAKLRKHMPSLVTIVAGRREDGEKMMGLISDGLVYRFLLKPISPGRSRLAIEASAKKHLTLITTDVPLSPADVQDKMTETGIIKGVTFDSGLFRTTDVRETNINMPSLDDDVDDSGFVGSISDKLRGVPPLLLAAIAVALTLIGVFLFSGDDEPAQPQIATVPADASRPAPVEETLPAEPAVDRFAEALANGRSALSENRLTDPADDNAVVHFAQAAALRREDSATRARLEQVLQQVFTGIENDLLADNLDGASQAVAVLNATVPGHPRLAFFNRQINKEQARQDLAAVEQLLNSGNIAGAGETVDRLRASGAVEPAILDALQNRLNAVNNANRQRSDVDTLIATANNRLASDQLISPYNDSAQFYFRSALDTEPGNAAARSGLSQVATALVDRARSQIRAGENRLAEQTLAAAIASGANAIEVESVRRQLETQQATTVREPRQIQSTRQPATDPAPSSAEPVVSSPAETTRNETAPVPTPPDSVLSQQDTSTNDTSVSTEPAPVAEAAEEKAATTNTDDALSDIELVVISKTPPEYPRSAQRRGVEGWVEVEFGVDADGNTVDVGIFQSTPGSVFDRAAIEAVSQWRYEPLETNDPTMVKRARVKLEFNLSQ
ncbi:MAG: TonB family protein [Woeseiaceae bacterium]